MGEFANRVFLVVICSLVLAPSAYADDMDFGGLEAEQVKDHSKTLEEGAIIGTEGSQNSTQLSTVDSTVGSVKVSSGSSGWSQFKRNIGVGFFNFSSVDADEVNRSKGYLHSYNYPTFEYRVGRGEKFFFRPAFLFQSSGQDIRGNNQDSKFTWSDAYFGYATYNLPWLPFDMEYKSEVRVYIPTSETSQNTGMIARIRGDMKAHYPLTSRLTFLLWFKPDYYIQKRTAYRTDRGYVNGTKDYGYELSANLYYRMRGGVWGLGGAVQHEQSWTHSSEVENVAVYRRDEVQAQVFVGVNAFGILSHIGAAQTRNVSNPSRNVAMTGFTDSETQYFARSYYRF